MAKQIVLSPSLLSADFAHLATSIKAVEKATNWLHLDVMDGHFVPNLTFGAPLIKCIREITDITFDAHLMVEHPCADRLVDSIHKEGMKAGIAIVPSTPLCAVAEVLPLVDLVLVMTVNPGFSGQKFIPYCVEKVRKLACLKEEKGYSYYVSVDGGINNETFPIVKEAGVDVVVSGSAFFQGNLDI